MRRLFVATTVFFLHVGLASSQAFFSKCAEKAVKDVSAETDCARPSCACTAKIALKVASAVGFHCPRSEIDPAYKTYRFNCVSNKEKLEITQQQWTDAAEDGAGPPRGLGPAEIAGIVVGAMIIIAVILGAVRYRKKKSWMEENIPPQVFSDPRRPSHRSEFDVAIICVLEAEINAVEALFDDRWDREQTYGKATRDWNAYKVGRIGVHNVVLASSPEMGTKSATHVATQLKFSFPNIRLALLVGVCGGVPRSTKRREEIVLGDVVISTGVVQYDYGRQYSDRFQRKDNPEENLPRPVPGIRNFLEHLRGSRGSRALLRDETCGFLEEIGSRDGFESLTYPGSHQDKLYESTYRHKHQTSTDCGICAACTTDADPICEDALVMFCEELGCSENNVIRRRSNSAERNDIEATFRPTIHFGPIASGNSVMKCASRRDAIASKEKVIAFEMEGAGVWEIFPVVIIKGVCDYADSHKNKVWQEYAAATAAACTKAFLKQWWREDLPSRISEGDGSTLLQGQEPFSDA